jgi:hypothetical protein
VSFPWIGVDATAAMPDPTVAAPADLAMRVTVSCGRTGGLVTSGSVVVGLTWRRTDLLPNGLAGVVRGMQNTDNLGLASVDGLDHVPGVGFPQALQPGLAWTTRTFVDTVSGANALSPVTWSSSSQFFDVGGYMNGIDPATIVAGRAYRGTFDFITQEGAVTAGGPAFRIRYDHQHRWGVEAIAYCGQTVSGNPVTTPQPPANQGLIP